MFRRIERLKEKRACFVFTQGIFAILVFAFTVTGCTAPHHHLRAYPGNARLPSEMAELLCGPHLWISAINGNSRYKMRTREGSGTIELLPGTHTITARYSWTAGGVVWHYTQDYTLSCILETGCSYQLLFVDNRPIIVKITSETE